QSVLLAWRRCRAGGDGPELRLPQPHPQGRDLVHGDPAWSHWRGAHLPRCGRTPALRRTHDRPGRRQRDHPERLRRTRTEEARRELRLLPAGEEEPVGRSGKSIQERGGRRAESTPGRNPLLRVGPTKGYWAGLPWVRQGVRVRQGSFTRDT